MSFASSFNEFLLPAKSFRDPAPDGPVDTKRLGQARCLMLVWYVSFGAFLCYLLWYIFFAGRIEVATTSYKQDVIEAPSVAICPFWPSTDVLFPADKPVEDSITVLKYGVDGEEVVRANTTKCQFDRGCACLNLYDAAGGKVEFVDHLQSETSNIGAMGAESERETSFRERVEVRTNITEPSSDKTLKVGFYDSMDKVPQWFYMAQASYAVGSLELQTWTVSDLTVTALWSTVKALLGQKGGDLQATFKQRHIFRYTSQEVANSKFSGVSSFVSFEMKHFFVDDTMSSETAFSPYSLLFLLVLIVIRSALRDVFVGVMFPKWEEKAQKVPARELSWAADTLTASCCCLACLERGPDGEKEPLL